MKSQETPEKESRAVSRLTRSQRVNKLLSPLKLEIICLIRRRRCEQVLMRSRTDLSTDLRSISDRSHLSDLSVNGALVIEKKLTGSPLLSSRCFSLVRYFTSRSLFYLVYTEESLGRATLPPTEWH